MTTDTQTALPGVDSKPARRAGFTPQLEDSRARLERVLRRIPLAEDQRLVIRAIALLRGLELCDREHDR